VKYFLLLMYVVSVLLGSSFFVENNVSAISENVLIYQVQTGSPASASEEIILLINSSSETINVNNWCLFYSSSSDRTKRKLSCVTTQDDKTELLLEPGGLLSFSSGEFVISSPGFVPDFTFASGMASTGGHVWIEDSLENTVDRLGWGSAVNPETNTSTVHLSGESLSRVYDIKFIDTDDNLVDFNSQSILETIQSGLIEQEIIIDMCENMDGIQIEVPEGYELQNNDCFEDFCLNIDDLQIDAPIGYEKKSGSLECTLIPLESATIFITELLPNSPSTDSGNEYIEIYNPNDRDINLEGYKIQVGPSFSKEFINKSVIIKSGEYIVYSDTESGVVLPNTNGVKLRMISPNGDVVDESDVYSNAEDDVSWAYVNDQWIYTNQITPGSANKPYLQPVEIEVFGVTSELAPCPLGKYRNPETNRCRNLETAVSSLKPCDENEYRNPDTNRCRKSAAVTTLSACSPGQERNPATNRCRKIASTSSLAACPVGQERNPETNRCRKVSVLGSSSRAEIPTVTDIAVENTEGQINWFVVIAALFGTFGYIIYEWRSEIAHSYSRLRMKLVQ